MVAPVAAVFVFLVTASVVAAVTVVVVFVVAAVVAGVYAVVVLVDVAAAVFGFLVTVVVAAAAVAALLPLHDMIAVLAGCCLMVFSSAKSDKIEVTRQF